jgi:hypothetical protein
MSIANAHPLEVDLMLAGTLPVLGEGCAAARHREPNNYVNWQRGRHAASCRPVQNDAGTVEQGWHTADTAYSQFGLNKLPSKGSQPWQWHLNAYFQLIGQKVERPMIQGAVNY